MKSRKTSILLSAVITLLCAQNIVFAQGIILPWVGPVNRGMGGAGTAAPLDALSAVYWNPAAMAEMQSELSVGVELLFPNQVTSSSITGLAAGTQNGEPGVIPLPQVGWVHKLANPRAAVGLGVVAAAGVRTNYAASTSNPLFLPQSNTPGVPGGLGQVFTEAQYIQLLPSFSYVINPRLSIGIGPTITIGQIVADPALLVTPDDADGSGVPRYASGRGSKFQWGGGVQLSAYYKFRPQLNFGVLIKSPQWMEEVDNFGTDELGLPRSLRANFDLPMVISLGTSYTGIHCTVLALDVRYIDHKNTDGFGPSGFNADGSLAGLGYDNSFGVMAGVQRTLRQNLTIRGGYTYTSNPLTDNEATVAVLAPLYYQHALAAGASLQVSNCASFNFTYQYAFENELSGPILTPLGPVPNSNVTTSLDVHAISLGVAVKY